MSCYSNAPLMDKLTRCIEQMNGLPLKYTKKLLELLETETMRQGLSMVFSICNPAGNMIAVHAMDDALLISFDLSMRKAYTAVALKTTTLELGQQVGAGQASYGVDRMGDSRIVIVAGGVPLIRDGRLIGGLGVSGGTGRQDHQIAEYGARLVAAPDFFTF